MRKRKWWTGIWTVLLCVMMVLTGPVGASAAGKADRSAYRSVFDASYYYSAYPDVAAACGLRITKPCSTTLWITG